MMSDDPFKKIDEIKHQQQQKAAEVERLAKENARLIAAREKFGKELDIKLDEDLHGYMSIVDSALSEFGARVWGFAETKKIVEGFWGSKETVIKVPQFFISELVGNVCYWSFYNKERTLKTPNTRGVHTVHGYPGDSTQYFVAPTIQSIRLASIEFGDIDSWQYDGMCAVGSYFVEVINYGEDSVSTEYLKEFLITSIEPSAIKKALVDSYIKNNS